ncbi:70-kilodalton heat shock protein [Gryganskiella cystojenkinii]|nr:70-kilodalton heat shock protein [Gryganskiella cystojenkinii]
MSATQPVVWRYKKEDGTVQVLKNELGNTVTPSQVAFADSGLILVGEAVKVQQPTLPINTIVNIKSLISQKSTAATPIPVRAATSTATSANQSEPPEYTPKKLTTLILAHLKANAETVLGSSVQEVVLTVPAYVSQSERQVLQEAATDAELKVLGTISDPVAAAIAYGLDKASSASGEGKEKGEQAHVLVFHLGGKTLAISVLSIDDRNGIVVCSTSHENDHFAGQAIDRALATQLAKEFKNQSNKDLILDPRVFQRLVEVAEQIKRRLSTETEVMLNLDNLIDGVGLKRTLNQTWFESVLRGHLLDVPAIVNQAPQKTGIMAKQVDKVIVTGGSSRLEK